MCISKFAPVVVFSYNRPDKVLNCLKHLERNPQSRNSSLIVFSDGPKSEKDIKAVEDARKALHEYGNNSKFAAVKVVESPKNKGLAKSIIEGITEVISEYGTAIIVEDDLIVSSKFLEYMNGALEYYKNDKRIGAISGYTYPLKCLENIPGDIYSMHKGDCWGWATWSDRWDAASWAEVDYEEYFKDKQLRKMFESTENGWDLLMLLQSEGKISSWAVRWVLNLRKKGLLTIYPKHSLVTNSGFDGSGTHSNKTESNHYFTALSENVSEFRFEYAEPDGIIEKEASQFPRKGAIAAVKYYLKRCYVKLYDIKRLLRF